MYTDWNNIDLERASERALNILDPYSFETLLLEISCNLENKELTADRIEQHFEKELQSKIRSAREVFKANKANIVKQAQKDRNE